jgi:hypothetical protein
MTAVVFKELTSHPAIVKQYREIDFGSQTIDLMIS